MADFGPDAGIQFVESASGHVASHISDASVAARLAALTGRTFQLDLQISIPRLQDFLASTEHVAEIAGGQITWKPDISAARVLAGGQATLFRNADATRTHKFVEFYFSFPGAKGEVINARDSKICTRTTALTPPLIFRPST